MDKLLFWLGIGAYSAGQPTMSPLQGTKDLVGPPSLPETAQKPIPRGPRTE